jgi:hypothetical protein
MATKAELENLVERLTAALKLQVDRNTELEAEIGRIRNEGGALAHLKRLYTDPTMPTSVTLKAAGLAAPFETPRMPVLSVGLDVSAFAARLAAARRGELEVIAEPGDEADTGDAGDAV